MLYVLYVLHVLMHVVCFERKDQNHHNFNENMKHFEF